VTKPASHTGSLSGTGVARSFVRKIGVGAPRVPCASPAGVQLQAVRRRLPPCTSTGTVGETPGLSAKGQPVDPGVGLPLLVRSESQLGVAADYRFDQIASNVAASTPAGTVSLSAHSVCVAREVRMLALKRKQGRRPSGICDVSRPFRDSGSVARRRCRSRVAMLRRRQSQSMIGASGRALAGPA
jgi:hypothetical protein